MRGAFGSTPSAPLAQYRYIMHTTSPGQTTIIAESGLPTGTAVGYQVLKATTGVVAIARTTTGVIENPVGSGNYVINFIAPAEGDLYLLVVDATGGILDPLTTRVRELDVTATVQPGSSGLGAVADYAKMHLGGENWKVLVNSSDYGAAFIERAVIVVKSRTMKTVPDTAGEVNLPVLVLDYLGLCVAIELIPALMSYWGSVEVSRSIGNDPAEIVTYPNRANLMKDLRDLLMGKLAAAQQLAVPLLDDPLLAPSSGPGIDECDDCKVTADPRDFPSEHDFPGPSYADVVGYPTRPSLQRSGVRV